MPSKVAGIAADVRGGRIPSHIYNDEDVFRLEEERVFGRSWVFLAHESEVPEPGDYVVRNLVNDSFIVVRDEYGTVRVHANVCLHRGMQVCRAEMGNASHFRCPYHGWSYRNTGDLVGVPFHKDAYGGDAGLDRSKRALISPPRVAVHCGLVFVSLDPAAPDLEDYLGDFAYYLDLYLKHGPDGSQAFGPQRWRIKANWKIGAENFAGDTYHTPHTHRSVVDIGLFGEPKPNKRKEGVLYYATVGGGTTYKLPPGSFDERMRYVGYPDEMIREIEKVWSPEQRALVADSGFMVSAASIYPNVSLVHNWPQVNEEGLVVPFVSLRQWQPIGPAETEVLSWFLVDRNAPQWFKDASYKAYIMSFGSSGMFEQDDVENWVSLTHVAGGAFSGRIRLDSRMGLDDSGAMIAEPYPGWAGPGTAYQGYGEQNQRALLARWVDQLERPGAAGPIDGIDR